MKIRTLALTIAFCLPMIFAANAQNGAALYVNAGYGFNAAPGNLESYDGNSHTVKPYSLGSGLNLDLGGSIMFGDHIGIGADLTFQTSPMASYTYLTGIGNHIVANSSFQGQMFAITPMLIVAGHTGSINLYGKFGLVFANTSVTYSETQTGNGAASGTYIDVYGGNATLGAYAAFGLQLGVSENVKLNLEIFDRTMAYSPATLTNTQPYDGDQKANTITYVDSRDNNSASDTQLKTYFPYSSIGLKLGIVFVLR